MCTREKVLVTSSGMTLVELMVAVTITALVMGLSLPIFFGQYESYNKRKEISEVQGTAPAALDVIRADLQEAGWSARPQMAFFLEDGGANDSDKIYVNDTSIIDINTPLDREILKASDCSGCQTVVSGFGTNTLEIAQPDIDGDGFTDFKEASSQSIISDAPNNKVAKINTITVNGATVKLNLDTVVDGTLVAPAVYYECSQSGTQWALCRSDRSSSGIMPLAENVVDLQVAYSQDGGANWFRDSSNAAPASFEPEKINLIRLTLVLRSKDRDMRLINDADSCRPAAENRAAAAVGTVECGYTYQTYVSYIRPRNFGMD